MSLITLSSCLLSNCAIEVKLNIVYVRVFKQDFEELSVLDDFNHRFIRDSVGKA